MASIINAATSGGLVTTADTSGILQLQTAGTTAVTVDASQNVGIGTTTIQSGAKLDVRGASNNDLTDLQTQLVTVFDTTSFAQNVGGGIGFGYKFNTAGNFVQRAGIIKAVKENATDGNYASALVFGTTANGGNTVERARLNSSGAFVLAGGTTSANGIGITFPASQSASTDPQTLDDYEEGTFTASIVGSSTAGTGTYSTRYGAYTKIGNTVAYRIFLIWSAHTGTGNISISGLPFSAASSGWSSCACRIQDLTLTASYTFQASVNSAATTIALEQVSTGGGAVAAIPMDTDAAIMLSGIYMV